MAAGLVFFDFPAYVPCFEKGEVVNIRWYPECSRVLDPLNFLERFPVDILVEG